MFTERSDSWHSSQHSWSVLLQWNLFVESYGSCSTFLMSCWYLSCFSSLFYTFVREQLKSSCSFRFWCTCWIVWFEVCSCWVVAQVPRVPQQNPWENWQQESRSTRSFLAALRLDSTWCSILTLTQSLNHSLTHSLTKNTNTNSQTQVLLAEHSRDITVRVASVHDCIFSFLKQSRILLWWHTSRGIVHEPSSNCLAEPETHGQFGRSSR